MSLITHPLFVEVDEIFNLACPASPIHYQKDPVQTTKTSVLGAINMLGLAKRLRIKVLQTSTSEVYGDPAVHPQTETYWGSVNPIGPRSCYDEGKRCAENVPLSDLSLVNLLAVQSLLIFAIACSRRLRFFFRASCSSPNSGTAAVQLPESRRSADQVSF